jgi:two-component system, NtrC family, sensor histidine kinase PilS
LAAIKHSAQLLEESPALPAEDRRLVEIMLAHCGRMNGIVSNVLGLARRERSQPEHVELNGWVRHFVDEFLAGSAHNAPFELAAEVAAQPVLAMADPQQLYQVVSTLVDNAIAYGHAPGEPARITLSSRVTADRGQPALEVRDQGPGIPSTVAAQVFEPFFTTSELGNGLGLYIARQLCEANQALLEYLPPPAGGACFRITLARPVPLVGRRTAAQGAHDAAE